jgi:serine/threonine protein kinase
MINESIAGYRIIRELGRGGMATVYLAEHELLRKKFAVKVLHYELARNTQIRNRFIKEARLMADMSNVGIVKVNNLIDAGDVVAMVMEYIDGQTLKEFLERKTRLSHTEIKGIYLQMLKAVEYAHNNQIVHRDLKPANFMIDRSGQVKLMDFGIAKSIDSESSEFTQTGTQIGTVMYMSPEQLENSKDIESTSDIYSLGVVLWQMVQGKKPYDSSNLNQFQIQKRIQSELLPQTNTLWDNIIQRSTAKNPTKRFRKIEELMHTIDIAFQSSVEETVLGVNINEKSKINNSAVSKVPSINLSKIAIGLLVLGIALVSILIGNCVDSNAPLEKNTEQNEGDSKSIQLAHLKRKSKEELEMLRNTPVEGLKNDTNVKSSKDSLVLLHINRGVFIDFDVAKEVETPNPLGVKVNNENGKKREDESPSPNDTNAKVESWEIGEWSFYTVKKGDTLEGIALKMSKKMKCKNITPETIMSDNNMDRFILISVGDRLKIMCH